MIELLDKMRRMAVELYPEDIQELRLHVLMVGGIGVSLTTKLKEEHNQCMADHTNYEIHDPISGKKIWPR